MERKKVDSYNISRFELGIPFYSAEQREGCELRYKQKTLSRIQTNTNTKHKYKQIHPNQCERRSTHVILMAEEIETNWDSNNGYSSAG